VFEIGFFSTTLTTRQNKTVFIPNKTILDGNLTNYSKTELIRLDLVYGISYADDVLRAMKILEDIVTSNDRVAENPPPQVSVSELGDNGVNFAVWPYVTVDDEYDVGFAITEQVKLRFDEEGISIPFPQRDVYLYQKNGVQTQLVGEV
jgi:small conductance mechanosensitive channel